MVGRYKEEGDFWLRVFQNRPLPTVLPLLFSFQHVTLRKYFKLVDTFVKHLRSVSILEKPT